MAVPNKPPRPQGRRAPAPRGDRGREPSLTDIIKAMASARLADAGAFFRGLGVRIFYGRERILCGAVCTLIMIVLALLETTVFSAVRPFGAVPDLMLPFVAAVAVTEGRRWGAVFGIVSGVVIESLGDPVIMLLPLVYMLTGFFVGVLCSYYITDGITARAILIPSSLPLRAVATAVYVAVSPVSAGAGEAFLSVILPEMGATLLLSLPVHLLVYVCLKPFHRTRAEKVSDK